MTLSVHSSSTTSYSSCIFLSSNKFTSYPLFLLLFSILPKFLSLSTLNSPNSRHVCSFPSNLSKAFPDYYLFLSFCLSSLSSGHLRLQILSTHLVFHFSQTFIYSNVDIPALEHPYGISPFIFPYLGSHHCNADPFASSLPLLRLQ